MTGPFLSREPFMFLDGLTNIVTMLGFGKGKAEHGVYASVKNDTEQLRAIYDSSWVAAKAIDMPVDDAVRKWRKWQGDPDLVDAYREREKELKLPQKTAQALKAARLMGGSAIFIGTNVKVVNQPLNDGEQVRFLSVIKRDEITIPHNHQRDPLAGDGEPDIYLINQTEVHKSRLIIFSGRNCVDDGVFGKSEITAAFDAIRNSDSVAANVAEMVFEAKLDVYKIPDLMLQDDNNLYKRLSLINQTKSTIGGIVLDSEEEYEQKQLAFSGIKDILFASYQIVAGAVGIPATKLLGTSVSGLNATGDNEVSDYDDLVQSIQAQIGNQLEPLDNLLVADLGRAEFKWPPLRNANPREEAEINELNARALQTLSSVEVFSDDVIYEAGRQLLGEAIPALEEIDNVF